MLSSSEDLMLKLNNNTHYFRDQIKALGFTVKEGTHPIVPIMLFDAQLAQNFAKDMLKYGIYVIGFSYPVVPQNEARIRVQISAAHSKKDLTLAINAFKKIGEKYKLI
jgi:glycine C-acetyltransferase